MLIYDEAVKKVILHAMADDCSMAILKATAEKGCSAMELIREFAFPPATVYRRIDELLGSNLLAVESIIHTEDGKKFSLYRSTT